MKKAVISGLILVTTGITPVIPEEMELLYSYQTTPQAIQAEIERIDNLPDVSTSTGEAIIKPEKPQVFEDDDKNGIISVSVFIDKKGNRVYARIPDEKYSDMGKPKELGKGILSNPKKNDYISLFESLTRGEEVNADVTLISTNGSIQETASGATSLTYAYDATGANYILVYSADLQADTLTGVTYNGVSLTQITETTRSPNEGSLQIYAHGLVNPASGSNNVVVSRSGTVATLDSVTYVFSGVDSTNPVNTSGTANGAGAAGTSLSVSITTTVDGAGITGWWVMDNGSITAGSNLTLDATGGAGNRPAFGSFRASTFPQVSAGSFTGTVNAANSNRGGILVALNPSAGGAVFSPWQINDF